MSFIGVVVIFYIRCSRGIPYFNEVAIIGGLTTKPRTRHRIGKPGVSAINRSERKRDKIELASYEIVALIADSACNYSNANKRGKNAAQNVSNIAEMYSKNEAALGVRTAHFALAMRLAYARLRRRARPAMPRTSKSADVGSGTTAAEGEVEIENALEAKVKSAICELLFSSPLIV